ncbi:MAG TPA: alpha/beta hydrolase [Acidobacteriaceae bacterium]|nr:alpha/beta hydrolase [Acidobacteriaceae bacterium]
MVNGVRLWYKVAGSGQPGEAPLVYLHGGPGYNSYSFEKTIGQRLERHVQIIYLDERGSGRSERPWGGDYTLSSFVEDLEGLRSSLGLSQISIMGHSFGGTIALEYAARYPSHVQKLIIVDGAADLPAAFGVWRQEIEQRYPQEWAAALKSAAGAQMLAAEKGSDACAVAKPEFNVEMSVLQKVDSNEFHHWQQFHDQRFEKEQEALDASSGLKNTGEIGRIYFDSTSQFPCYRFAQASKLTMPTLVIAGKYDGAIGVEQMRALAASVNGSQFDEFDQSGHFPYAEEPSKFEHDVLAFLAQR